jgi:hypothetical protein
MAVEVSASDRVTLSRYLLGQLFAIEEDAVEDRFAADNEYFGLYEEVECALISDYAASAMVPADAELFERNYLVSEERRRRVQVVRALLEVESEERNSAPKRSAYWKVGFACVLTAFVVVAAVVLFFERRWQSEAPPAVAHKHQPATGALAKGTAAASPALPPLISHSHLPAAGRSISASGGSNRPNVSGTAAPPIEGPTATSTTAKEEAALEPIVPPEPPLAPGRPNAEVARPNAKPAVMPVSPEAKEDAVALDTRGAATDLAPIPPPLAAPAPGEATQINVGDSSAGVRPDQIPVTQFDLPRTITLPAGTAISVRTIDPIDSKKADLSREYAASLDDPVIVNGVPVIPAKAAAFLRVTDKRNSHIHRASLSISLIAVKINGQRVEVKTGDVDSQSGSQAKRALIGAAAGAGTGAAIGAIAGGVGAGVGAAAGAAAGGVTGLVTGKGVTIASETRFTYKLTEPVVINGQEVSPPAEPPKPPEPPKQPGPAVGQTIEQVTAAFGQPKVILDLGPKKIYVYPDLKVTFVDGKVSDVGH